MRSGRSKRKNRFGGSVRASADSPPPAKESSIYRPLAGLKRVSLEESFGPGRSRILWRASSAGAGLAVIGRNGPMRASAPTGWPGGGRGPMRASAPTPGIRETGGPTGPPLRRHSEAPAAPAPTRRGGFHIRPSNRPRQPPRQRQRGQKDQPFDNHPEVRARPANAAQDRCNCQSPARVGRRVSYYSRKRFRRPPLLSVGARSAPATRQSVLFFWTGRGPFSFRQDRKENGGAHCRGDRRTSPRREAAHPPPPFRG